MRTFLGQNCKKKTQLYNKSLIYKTFCEDDPIDLYRIGAILVL